MTVTETCATRSLTLNGLTVTARIPTQGTISSTSTPENLSESDFYHELEIYQKLLRGDCENGSPKMLSKCSRVPEGDADDLAEDKKQTEAEKAKVEEGARRGKTRSQHVSRSYSTERTKKSSRKKGKDLSIRMFYVISGNVIQFPTFISSAKEYAHADIYLGTRTPKIYDDIINKTLFIEKIVFPTKMCVCVM